MNPSPTIRNAIYLILAITNAIVFLFAIITGTYTSELLIALTGFNTLGFALANANTPKA